MIKRFLFSIFLLTCIFSFALAQDTTAYEIQRAKINGLLAQRSAKFGAYDLSLKARTGIFGLQTKRDIKNSNEILRQIALTDNRIFKELKVLLDYRNIQMDEAKSTVDYNKTSIVNYRKTIKDLQAKNQDLSRQLSKAETSSTIAHLFMALFLFGCGWLAYLLSKYRREINAERQKHKS